VSVGVGVGVCVGVSVGVGVGVGVVVGVGVGVCAHAFCAVSSLNCEVSLQKAPVNTYTYYTQHADQYVCIYVSYSICI